MLQQYGIFPITIAVTKVIIGPTCISLIFSVFTKRARIINFPLKKRTINPIHQFIVLSAAPIPGGCNMEFNTEIAPYARIQTRDTMVIVDVQPASLSFNSSCENVSVEVEMYQMFLHEQDFTAETYFMGIVNMLTVQDIKNNGAKVSRYHLIRIYFYN